MKIDIARTVIAVCLWILVVFASAGYYVWQWLETPVEIKEPYRLYEIEKGHSLTHVANHLSSKRLMRWPKLWIYYARFMNMTKIKAGEYELAQKESPLSLLARFQSGNVVQHQITLVEGLTYAEFIDVLHSHKRIKQILGTEEDVKLFLDAGIELDHLEGWFYPDTYQFTSGDSDLDLLVRAYQKMRERITSEWRGRDESLPYETPYAALIMASIVEKETGAAFERKQIAGVFVRRLRKNIRLQTDPTVIYGMGDAYQGNITRKDLKTYTLYNTYMIKGLPPTPIAMPGGKAIHAALHPAGGEALYFVAKGDGTHKFSKTLEEHLEAVSKYQLKRRSDYKSVPPIDTEMTSQVNEDNTEEVTP